MKKLIPAIVMLLVSAVVLSTASYAWFTTTEKATATGMQVTANAPSSILIRETGTTTFGSYVTLTAANAQKVLKPASSFDGITFYGIDKCEDASGAMAHDANITTVTNGENNYYYLDLQVDLLNAGAEAKDLVLSQLTINGVSDSAIAGAVRVALIVTDTVADEEGGEGATKNVTKSYVYAKNATNTYVKYGVKNQQTGATEYVASTGVLFDTTTKAGKAEVLSTNTTPIITLQPDSGNSTAFTTVTIRVWIEGQDADCISAVATGSATVELVFAAANPTT